MRTAICKKANQYLLIIFKEEIMRKFTTDVVSARQININYQLSYNPYGIDPEATTGQVTLFGPAVPVQQNNGFGDAGEVGLVGAEGAEVINDIVQVAADECCVVC